MNITSLVEIKKNPKIPDITPGDTVRVSTRIVEGGKERIQVFQGVVIQVRRGGAGASFTVRHVAFGIGVERTFPLYSPLIEKVEVVRHGKVRRAKLYYLRGLSGRKARRKIKRVDRKVKGIGEELLEAEPEEILEPVLEAETEEVAEEEAEAAVEEEPAQEEVKAEEPVAEPEAVEGEPTLEKEPEPVPEEGKVATPGPEQAPVVEKEEEAEAVVESAEDRETDKETP